MRAAIISDIHGNLVSLRAVMEDVEVREVDRVVCLGDVAATGPRPRETVERLAESGFPVVMGNADEDLLHPERLEPESPDEDERRISEIDFWCASQLSQAHRDFIRSFQKTVEVSPDDDTRLLLFHGSPFSNTEIVSASMPDREIESKLGIDVSGAVGDVFAGGHTHSQTLRRLGGVTFVNPGSVGLPVDGAGGDHNPPWAEYAVVFFEDGFRGVEFLRVPVDVEKVRNDALESEMPHAGWWASDWRE